MSLARTRPRVRGLVNRLLLANRLIMKAGTRGRVRTQHAHQYGNFHRQSR